MAKNREIKPKKKVKAFLNATCALLVSEMVICLTGGAIGICLSAACLIASIILVYLFYPTLSWIIACSVVALILSIIQLVLGFKIIKSMKTMKYDLRPTVARCSNSDVMLLFILAGGFPALILHIIQFVRMKKQVHLITLILSAQENTGWKEMVTDEAVDNLKYDDYLLDKASKEAMQKKIAEDAQMPFDPDCILEVRHLRKTFPLKKTLTGKVTKELVAVNDISFKLKAGETLGIVGESGCGKTTAGRAILKLHQPTGGQIIFGGTDITHLKPREMRKFRKEMQIIFQDPYSSLPPRDTVGGILTEPVHVHGIVPKSEEKQYVLDLMDKCGLRDYYYERYPHEFSGGQRQRICIARALSVEPKLVICDEPVSALDVSIQAQIINLLKKLQREMNLAYVFISHDLSVVKFISDKIAVLYLGNMMEYGTKEDIFRNPLHPYTRALFSAIPNPDPTAKMHRIKLEGDIPSPANPPKGCKFHTRCPYATEKCKHVIPEYKEHEPGHFAACHLLDEE